MPYAMATLTGTRRSRTNRFSSSGEDRRGHHRAGHPRHLVEAAEAEATHVDAFQQPEEHLDRHDDGHEGGDLPPLRPGQIELEAQEDGEHHGRREEDRVEKRREDEAVADTPSEKSAAHGRAGYPAGRPRHELSWTDAVSSLERPVSDVTLSEGARARSRAPTTRTEQMRRRADRRKRRQRRRIMVGLRRRAQRDPRRDRRRRTDRRPGHRRHLLGALRRRDRAGVFAEPALGVGRPRRCGRRRRGGGMAGCWRPPRRSPSPSPHSSTGGAAARWAPSSACWPPRRCCAFPTTWRSACPRSSRPWPRSRRSGRPCAR